MTLRGHCLQIRKRVAFTITLIVAFSAQTNATTAVEQQRQNYKLAQQSLANNDFNEYQRLRKKLEHYSLTPYLDYSFLLKKLEQKTPDEISSFSKQYDELPFVSSLPYYYLTTLGSRKRWDDFTEYFPNEPHSENLRCYYFRAKLAQGEEKAAWQGANKLWLKGTSIDDACDPLIKAWNSANQLTDELILQRMLLVFEQKNAGLLKHLNSKLNSKDSEKMGRDILDLYQNPQTVAEFSKRSKVTALNQRLVEISYKRLVRKDIKEAVKQYPLTVTGQHLSAETMQSLSEYAAFRLFTTSNDELITWRDKVIENASSIKLIERRIRLAVQEVDWKGIERWVALLPKEERLSLRWQYWKARAELETGKESEGKERLAKLLGQRNFYSVAAANALNKPIRYPMRVAANSFENIAQFEPSLLRIKELLILDKFSSARSEWQYLLKRSDEKQALELASYASEQRWPHFTVLATIKGRLWGHISLRFPIAHQGWFDIYSDQSSVDKITMMALSRQESALFPQANSPVGARGLMQIMPTTARYTAKKMGITYQGDDSLYDISVNMDIGSSYLKGLLEQYEDNRIYALAGYNAGPHRVKQWRKRTNGELDAYAFIESIPFKETRGYVQNILMFETYYRDLLGVKGSFLSQSERKTRY
ncbi:murein transglycosylase [Aliivibrio kagoshimensis]|uniref:murein transglycosylase n=1 Tax=Aliivibrio kagoshimensis TaxID=2910230 RepID=UPI003D1394E5